MQDLLLDEAELRFGVSDPRGLQSDAKLTIGGKSVALQPGKGVGKQREFRVLRRGRLERGATA